MMTPEQSDFRVGVIQPDRMHQGRLGPDQGSVLALFGLTIVAMLTGRRGPDRFDGPDDGGLVFMLV